MTSAAIPRTTDSPSPRPDRAARVLSVAVTVWYLIAVAGQWLFAAYIVALYGRAVVVGDTSAWTRVMPNGRVEGDGIGNAVLMSHVLLAVIIMIGGPLQLVPWLRSRFRAVHRWTGRAYMSAAITISAGGLYLVWVRGSDSRFIQHLGISLDGVLVLVFSVLAYRTARARHIAAHRRWALRLFVVSSGVWFFRVGVFLSLLLNGGPFGFDAKTFDGPFLQIMAFADYLVPLAILEGYFLAQRRETGPTRAVMTALLGVASIVTAAGIVAVFMIAWRPHLV
jgi:hypothetical protein